MLGEICFWPNTKMLSDFQCLSQQRHYLVIRSFILYSVCQWADWQQNRHKTDPSLFVWIKTVSIHIVNTATCFLPVCLLCFPFYNNHDGFRRASCSCWSATRSDPERVSRRADWDWGAIPNPDCRAVLLGSFLWDYHPSLVSVGAPPFLGQLNSKKHPRWSRTDKFFFFSKRSGLLRAPASERNNPGRTSSRWLLQAERRSGI